MNEEITRYWKEGEKITDFCYELEGGEYYTILAPEGWVAVMFMDTCADGYSHTYYEH